MSGCGAHDPERDLLSGNRCSLITRGDLALLWIGHRVAGRGSR
jgi:hypothetical protein